MAADPPLQGLNCRDRDRIDKEGPHDPGKNAVLVDPGFKLPDWSVARSKSLGQFLYTLYEVPLGPGAELALALRTASRVPDFRQLQLRHVKLHIWFRGFYEVVRFSKLLLSCGVTVQLLQMLVCLSARSPSTSLVNLKGLAMKAARLRSLSLTTASDATRSGREL